MISPCRIVRVCATCLVAALSPFASAETADEQLATAIEKGDLADARDAIQAGARVRDAHRALLEIALSYRRPEMIDLLLNAGVDPNRAGSEGITPAMMAVSYPEIPLAALEHLWQAGAQLDVRHVRGGLILQALRAGRDDMARWLLEHKAPVNVADRDGVTELMVVAQREVIDDSDLVDLVRRLLHAGANAAPRDTKGQSAGDRATERGYARLLALLEPGKPSGREAAEIHRSGLNHGLAVALRAHAESRFHRVARLSNATAGQLETIQRLLQAGADPNAPVKSWRGPMAAFELAFNMESSPPFWVADPAVLDLLLKHGAKWESCGDRLPALLFELAADPKALAVALNNGLPVDSRTVQAGLDAKLRPTTVTMSLLHAAAWAGAVDSIDFLLAHGADLNARDSDGYTPLMRAVAAGREAAVDLLLANGAREDTAAGAPTLADLAASAGLISRLRSWDHSGTYRDLTDQFPPQPNSRWLGDWVIGTGPVAGKVVLRPDGMGQVAGGVFAWRETEDGIRIRLVGRHPKLPQMTMVQEFALNAEPDGSLGPSAPSASGPMGGSIDWWVLRRPGQPAIDPEVARREAAARQVETETEGQLAALRSGRSTYLSLNGAGRSTLPPELLRETAWTDMRVNWIELGELPADLSHWVALDSVYLGNQRALRLAPGCLDLPKLRILEITNARLTSLPLQFAALPALVSINVYNNRLEQLPTGWRQARRLVSVSVADNRLKALPADIGEAPALATLNASGNQLTGLPDSLANAPIQTLGLSDNRLKEIPAAIAGCLHLTYLSLDLNEIEDVPSWLADLPQLQNLDLARNHLRRVPDLRNARALQRLILRDNQITELPDDPAWLPASVKELDLSDNQLSRVPAWLETRAFSRLDLRGNLLPDAEARRLANQAEQRWRNQRK